MAHSLLFHYQILWLVLRRFHQLQWLLLVVVCHILRLGIAAGSPLQKLVAEDVLIEQLLEKDQYKRVGCYIRFTTMFYYFSLVFFKTSYTFRKAATIHCIQIILFWKPISRVVWLSIQFSSYPAQLTNVLWSSKLSELKKSTQQVREI